MPSLLSAPLLSTRCCCLRSDRCQCCRLFRLANPISDNDEMPSLTCSCHRYYRLVSVAVVPTGADAVTCSVTPIRSVIMTKCLPCSLPRYY
eukprot:scaffold20529_cov53-Attheya_sp.AAC.1